MKCGVVNLKENMKNKFKKLGYFFTFKSNDLTIFESKGKYKQSYLFLTFLNKKLEESYLQYNRNNSLFQSRVAAILGVLMYPAFLLLDSMLFPEEFLNFIFIRVIITLYLIIIAILQYNDRILKLNESVPVIELVAITTVTIAQIGHLLIMVFTSTPPFYDLGIFVIILFYLFGLTRIRFQYNIIISISFIACFEIIMSLSDKYSVLIMITMNFFLFSIAITSVLSGYIIEYLLRRKFVLLMRAKEANEVANKERDKSEKLLLNILPKEVAEELKLNGFAKPRHFESATVMFTDFAGFTKIADSIEATDLVNELDKCFSYFDSVCKKYKLEKIKTIGDSYMTCGGIPLENYTHPIDTVLAAMEIQSFMNHMKEIKEIQNLPYWELRLGINSGSLVAGVIGEMKFAYDVFGDTVNIASRMESSSLNGKINISKSTYELVKDFFECEYRGKIAAKNKGLIDMYFVNGIKPELSKDEEMRVPNEKFQEKYTKIKTGK